jgi:hypothetical protein
MLKAPAFFFPTTILMLDDDRPYLEILTRLLSPNFKIVTFPDARSLEKHLKQDCVLAPDAPNEINQFLPLDSLAKMRGLVESGLAQYLVSAVVIDQHLDNELGCNLFAQLSDTCVQKVLISNFIQDEHLREAYNRGLIDAFVPKMDVMFIESLTAVLRERQIQYFILKNRAVRELQGDNKFSDQSFCNYFKDLVERLSIISSIPNDDLNTFSMRSSRQDGDVLLYAASDHDFEAMVNSLQAETAPDAILTRINQRKALPIFNGALADGYLWAEHMRPVTPIGPEQKYFVSCHSTFLKMPTANDPY